MKNIKKRIFSVMLVIAMLLTAFPQMFVSAQEEDMAYLFAYFTGNNPEQERMFYAVSTDGYNFSALNGGNAVYTNPVGTGCLRDPYIFEGEDGKFYALATDMKSSLGWASNRSIITMVSDDLISWETNLIPVTELFDSMSAADRVWAPQAIYDSETGKYMIYLAVRTNDGTDNGGKTVMYRCWTEDFKTITEPELMFAPADGSSAIDGDIIRSDADGRYYMYYKNENTARLYTATADSLGGTFTETGTMLPCSNSAGNEAGVEGPAIYKLIGQNRYNIIYDAYGEGFFVMSQTSDHNSFTQLEQAEYSFNFTPRHGYVVPINQKEYDKLLKAYGADETIKLSPSKASPFNNGEFQGWGTSMGWWGNRIGYSDTLAQTAAKLFYSEDGLSLDIVRYNVGGGDNPAHNYVTRSDSKMPCFAVPEFEADGTTLKTDENGDVIYSYNWDADYNQVNVLQKIKAENPDVHIEGYTNSPPWFMTNSKCSGGGTDGSENLDPKNYDNFASFIADVTKHFEDIGLKFDSYSPMNEPNPATGYWKAFSPKQEGNHVAPGEHQSGIINALSRVYDERGIDTMVVGLDETSIDYSISSFAALDDEAKANLDRLDTHSYSGSKRAQLKQTALDGGKNLWMSEVDHGKTAGTKSGNMGMALDLAGLILADINGMQPSAWVMWDILDFHKDSEFTAPDGTKTEANNALNQDGGLWGVGMVNHDSETIELTQKYYGYGQFTKYIQPGMTIIESSDNSVAAYDKNTGEIVIVAVNFSDKDKLTEFDLRDFSSTGDKARVIRTSGSYESGEHWAQLEPVPVSNKEFYALVKANSITTFVIGTDARITEFTADSTGLTYKYDISSFMNNYDRYFAVYDSENRLKTITINESEKTLEGDFTGCTAKLMIWENMNPEIPYVAEVMEPIPVSYMTIEGSSSVVSGIEYEYAAYINSAETPADVTWSVSDDTAASVTADGRLTAHKAGTVTLSATTADGQTTSLDIEVIDASKPVTIVNKKSGLGLETRAKGIASGTQLVQWEYRGIDTSAWQLIPTDDGLFNIVNKNADMLLVSNADAKPVISSDIAGEDNNAKWELINHSGYYEIRNISVQKSLNVSGQSVANGGNVILYEFGGGDNELWSLRAVDGELEHIVPVETDYSEKYADSTEYSFVSNISAATNDFNDGELKGFEVSGAGAVTADGAGENVLGVQSKYSNKDGQAETGSASLVPETALTCEEGQIINMAFDIYCSNSGGTADFILYGAEDTEFVKMEVSGWDNYTMTVAGTETVENGGAKTYLRNGVNDKTYNQLISNGGHIEIYFTPSTGDIKITLKNNTNNSEMKTYTGNVGEGAVISKLAFNANYTTWSKPMYVDNLVTNIITAK